MIDVETDIFNIIATKVREKYSTIFVTGEYVKSPSSFPCITVVETDNQILERTRTGTETENHVQVMYEVNVFSNKTVKKKTECKEIIAFVDKILVDMGFTRTMMTPIPNEEDATIYRMVGRYRAIVSKNNVIYRR